MDEDIRDLRQELNAVMGWCRALQQLLLVTVGGVVGVGFHEWGVTFGVISALFFFMLVFPVWRCSGRVDNFIVERLRRTAERTG